MGIFLNRKNLCKYTVETKQINGVTFTTNTDGSVTAVGKATANALYKPPLITLETGNYILTGCPSGGSSSTFCLNIPYKGSDYGSGLNMKMAEPSELEVRVVVYSGTTVNHTFYPMIRKAEITDATYEPYFEKIKLYASSGSKNLLYLNNCEEESQGVHWKCENGVITVKGIAPSGEPSFLYAYDYGDRVVLTKGTYTLSCDGIVSEISLFIGLTGTDGSYSNSVFNENTFTLNYDCYIDAFDIYAHSPSGAKEIDTTLYIMLNHGEDALPFEEGHSAKVKSAYLGNEKVYSSGNTVEYITDFIEFEDYSYHESWIEEVDGGESCLNPTTFTPVKDGWTFIGWRDDTIASGETLGIKTMGEEPITLYAVYEQDVTLSYSGNGASGSMASQTGKRYYNAYGTYNNPTFVLAENEYSRSGYIFLGWDLGAVGSMITLEADGVASALWSESITVFDFTGEIQIFTAPVSGTYLLETWGASGGRGIDSEYEHGGLGGYSKGTVYLEAGQTIFVCVGEKGTYLGDLRYPYAYTSSRYNGGGKGYSYGGDGGGATHFATTNRGVLANYEQNKSELLLVAAGGGANSYDGSYGGTGGGITGGNPSNTDGDELIGFGATQTGIGSEDYRSNGGGFGYGGNGNGSYGGGGGAGLFGGNGGYSHMGGGGGSGYIGGVNEGHTENGVRVGHGYARASLIS